MPTAPISMRKLKEILRLKYGCKLSHRKIANSLSVSPSIVSRYATKSAELGVTFWPLDEQWLKTKTCIRTGKWSCFYLIQIKRS